MTRPRVFFTGGVTLAAVSVLLAGCTNDPNDPNEAPSPIVSEQTQSAAPLPSPSDEPTASVSASAPRNTQASPLPSPQPATGELATAQAAVEAALTVAGGGVALEAGQTDEAGRQVWYVLVRDDQGNGTELYLARDNADVVQQQPESLPAEARDQVPTQTAEQGMGAALTAVPGEVTEFDLSTEEGRVVWAVLVSGASGLVEVYVDAETGGIIKQKSEN